MMDKNNEKPKVLLTPTLDVWLLGSDLATSVHDIAVAHAEVETFLNDARAHSDRLLVATKNLLLVTMEAVSWQGVVAAFEHGAKKYEPMDWMKWEKEEAMKVYTAASKRHLLAILFGEEIDPESGLRHMAHVAACALILVHFS